MSSGHVPDVDVHAGHHRAAGQPERDELQRRRVAPVHDLVVVAGLGQPGRLHAQVVLVAEEVRHPVVGHRLAEHGAGRGRAAVQRVGPVLHPDPAAQQRVGHVGHVTGREDVRVAGPQRRVHQDAVARPPGRPASARATLGAAPMATTTTSAGSSAPSEVSTAVTRPSWPRSSRALSPSRNSTPCARCRSANRWPSSGPTCRCSGVGSGSSTVTVQPFSRAAAATSRPIQPPPTMTTRVSSPGIGASAVASASESAAVRR